MVGTAAEVVPQEGHPGRSGTAMTDATPTGKGHSFPQGTDSHSFLVAACMRHCNDISIFSFSNDSQPVARLLTFSHTGMPKLFVLGLWVVFFF